MNTHRWNPYVLISDADLEHTFLKHFTPESKIVVVMGKGFDVRMNIAVNKLKACTISLNITCFLIDFDEGLDSSSHQYSQMVKSNEEELESLIGKNSIKKTSINLWQTDSRRRIGDRRAAAVIDKINLSEFSDIIVDISALPRGIYFSMIGKLLTLIDAMEQKKKPNLMVAVAENPNLDKATQDDSPDDEPNFLHGFSGQVDNSSDSGAPSVWMPILGENKEHQLRKAYTYIDPNETCPILPFPSRDPRRPDSLIVKYHGLLFDELNVEQQNIMYVPEHNPFEAYKILSRAILNYRDSLKPIGDCKIILSTFSSKLLSIGMLLAAYEFKIERY